VTNFEYLKWAMTKDRSDIGYLEHKDTLTASKCRLINGALGLSGEAGEVVDIIKKHVQFNKQLDINKLKEELGDLMWYINLILFDINSNIEEIMEINKIKLDKRFPNKFSEEQALKRQDENT
jgi:NTP pyrophosphatase (non-canonical NTP hydrolase)